MVHRADRGGGAMHPPFGAPRGVTRLYSGLEIATICAGRLAHFLQLTAQRFVKHRPNSSTVLDNGLWTMGFKEVR